MIIQEYNIYLKILPLTEGQWMLEQLHWCSVCGPAKENRMKNILVWAQQTGFGRAISQRMLRLVKSTAKPITCC